jgi:hypothetical protein
MPFAFLLIGALVLVAGVRGTGKQLITLVKGDFTGTDNFAYWMFSILVIGAFGYVPELKPISRGFMGLVILVLFLKSGNSNNTGGGFFKQFQVQAFGALPNTAVSATSTGASGTAFLSQNLDTPSMSAYADGQILTSGLTTTNPDIQTLL